MAGSSESSFKTLTCPPGHWAKTSVKVPPRSMAKWKRPSGLPMMTGLESSSDSSAGRTGQRSLGHWGGWGSSTGGEPRAHLGWGIPGPGWALGGARAAGPCSEGSLRQGQSWQVVHQASPLSPPQLPCSQCPGLGWKPGPGADLSEGEKGGRSPRAGCLGSLSWRKHGVGGRSGQLHFPTARPSGQGHGGQGMGRSLRR